MKFILMKHFGVHARALRTRAGLTQGDVARELCYKSAQFISNWERGASLPPLEALPILARIFKVKTWALLEMYFNAKERVLADEKKQAAKKLKVRP